MKPLGLVRAAAMARIGIGGAMALAAGPILRATLRDESPSSSFVLFARTVGIRDAVFGFGCRVRLDDRGDRSCYW